MKQEILRFPNGSVQYIINYNNSQRYGLSIDYHYDGSIWYIQNWTNDKRFGLYT